MQRYILTGAPGSGKTTLIHALQQQGYCVIHEAATHIIEQQQAIGLQEPWQSASFIDLILAYQKEKQLQATHTVQFYDRSPFCTYALAMYLKKSISPALKKEIDRCLQYNIYESRVFFIQHLNFIEHTAARTISFEEALRFEDMHQQVYEQFGFTCIMIENKPIEERVIRILNHLLPK